VTTSSRAEASALLLQNARIHGHPTATGVVIAGGRIRAVGPTQALRQCMPTETATIDLKGGALLPGFIDAHIHLLHTGLVESGWQIALQGRSRSETLGALAAACGERTQQEWVVGYGWDESTWAERAYITKKELDTISTSIPIVAIRLDGHLLSANTAALAQLPEETPEELVDSAQGILREGAVASLRSRIIPDFDAASAALDAAAALCHRLGITGVHTMSGLSAPHFDAFMAHRAKRRLHIRVCPAVGRLHEFAALGIHSDFGDEWVRFGGMKGFADGSIGAQNAALSSPYETGGLGALNYSDETVQAWIRSSNDAGWQTLIHAIGDRAIDQVLSAHEVTGSDPSLRHRIEHLELPNREQLSRMKRLGVMASMQPNFTGNWSGPESLYVNRLGEVRDAASNPLRWIIDEGIPLAFGSDGMPPSPLYGLHCAVNGAYDVQRVSVNEAIDCYTRGGAMFGFEEHECGTIEVGKRADLVLLDEPPTVRPNEIRDRQVLRTFVNGECVYERGETA